MSSPVEHGTSLQKLTAAGKAYPTSFQNTTSLQILSTLAQLWASGNETSAEPLIIVYGDITGDY